MRLYSPGLLYIASTFLLAMILTFLPLPAWISELRPQWIALVLFYWVIAVPERLNLGTAFLIGILLDVLQGSPLGEQALLLTLLAYAAAKGYRQIRVFPLSQQAILISGLILLYQILLQFIHGMFGLYVVDYWFWLSALSSACIWPWIFVILRDGRRRFGIQ